MSRSNPFLETNWLSDFLPFDPLKDSTHCEFTKSEQLYGLIGAYIVKQSDHSFKFTPKPNTSKATRILERLARIAKHSKLGAEDKDKEEKYNAEAGQHEKNAKEKVITSLGLGLFQFSFENDTFYAVHQIIGDPVGGMCGGGMPLLHQSLIVFVKGRGKLETLKHFVDHIIISNETKQDSLFFKIYRFDMQRMYWKSSGKKIARDPETIILPLKTWSTLMDDFERFLDEKSIKWYFKHGIPYKRSYLFYGVPGSGKTSLIQALAAKYDRNLCFLQPTHPKMTDQAFKTCISSAPGNSLIVLEDIDALFNADRSKKDNSVPLTFSGLLNGLDGVGNPDGQIFIMTTNYVDRLDTALVRSGRVDLHIEFPLGTDEQLQKMFLLFYPKELESANQFVVEIRKNFTKGISMAAVQQHFIQNMFKEAEVVIANVKQLGDRLDVVAQYDKQKKDDDKTEEDKKEDKKEIGGKKSEEEKVKESNNKEKKVESKGEVEQRTFEFIQIKQ